MKKITVTLSDKAEKYFNDIMYSLPRHADGSGMCTQSQAINYTLVSLQAAEKKWEAEKDQEPEITEKELWEEYSEHRTVNINDFIGLQCMDECQFKAAIKKLKG